METSTEVGKLAEALAKAQGQIEGAVKGKVNPAFRSKYADLASVWDACRDALTANGLSVIQSPGEIAEGRMAMTTMLLHASGEWVRGHLTIPLGKVDAHGYGSATTYARRFALAAFVGVAPEDDDGNAAAKAKPTGSRVDPNSLAQKKRDGVFETMQAEIEACETVEQLTEWGVQHADTIHGLPEAWRDALRDRFQLHREQLTAEPIPEAEEMDEAFRASVGPTSPRGVAGAGGQRQEAA
jgi:hypothetical protein